MHHFTIDVEEYFHPTALMRHYPMERWDSLERRSPGVIERLLELLDQRGTKGTFFVLGWLAEREPRMVESIVAAGHEVASHGYAHRLVGELGPEGFRDSVRRSKAALEEITGQPVLGYRAPSFSITPGREWAFDVLLEEGYAYDASLFPIKHHPTYGYPEAPRDPHWIDREAGRIAEFPASILRVGSLRVPASGGAYFRFLPYAVVRSGISGAARRDAPGMFYLHPWELDDWIPEVDAPWLQRFRTFGGRKRAWRRMRRLLDAFDFDRIDRSLAEMRQ